MQSKGNLPNRISNIPVTFKFEDTRFLVLWTDVNAIHVGGKARCTAVA